MSAEPSRIVCTIDLDAPGRQSGLLTLAHSDNEHAYGVIGVPIASIANGYGPTVLVTAGNHGDEHEGPLVVRRLFRDIATKDVRGRILLMPSLNHPAVLADSRVSPVDGGNMNRAYPGDPVGTPTFAIAHYVESVLLARCDATLDLHSGGKASEFLPCAFLVRSGDADFLAAKLAAVSAFGAPDVTVVGATADGRSLSAAADRQGVVNMATELGGGGTVGVDALRIGHEGTLRWLAHSGVLKADDLPSPVESRYLRTRDRNDFVMAPIDGVFEPAVSLGDAVEAGDRAGVMHRVDDPFGERREVTFAASGVVVCRRVPARARAGDWLFHIGESVTPASLLA